MSAVVSIAGLEAHHDDHRAGPGVKGARHVRHPERARLPRHRLGGRRLGSLHGAAAAACLHCMSSLPLPSSTASRHYVPPSKGPACATVFLPDGADTRCITVIVGVVDDSLMSVSLLQRCATVCCCRPTTTWRSWTRYIHTASGVVTAHCLLDERTTHSASPRSCSCQHLLSAGGDAGTALRWHPCAAGLCHQQRGDLLHRGRGAGRHRRQLGRRLLHRSRCDRHPWRRLGPHPLLQDPAHQEVQVRAAPKWSALICTGEPVWSLR